MLFGIQAARDTLVSEIARTLGEGCLAKKTQERLERHLRGKGMAEKIHGAVLRDAARQCTPRYEDGVEFRSRNKVRNVRVQYGSMPVCLPVRPGEGSPAISKLGIFQ